MPPSPALDPRTVAMLRRVGGDRLLAEMAALYREHAVSRLDAAEVALGRSDAESLARIAHSLRSSAGQIGARAVAALAGEIEEDASKRRLGAVGQLLKALRGQVAESIASLDSEVAGRA